MLFSWKSWGKTHQPDIEATAPEASDDSGQRRSGALSFSREYRDSVGTKSIEEFRRKLHRFTGRTNEENGETSVNYQPRSSRHLAELLSPDQESVNAILQHRILVTKPEFGKLVSGYFSNDENVYSLCSRLLDNIDRARLSYSKIKNILDLMPTTGEFSEEQCHWIGKEFVLFMEFENPFPHPDSEGFQSIHDCFQDLLQQFKFYDDKVRRKLKLITGLKKGSSLCLIGVCIAIVVCAVIIATLALVAIVVVPVLVTIEELQCESMNSLRRHSVQLDAAIKGTYILSKDLDTMSRLVARLHNKVENNKDLIEFCLQRKDDRHPIQGVVQQLRKSDFSFGKTLDEIEESVVLCLMTINRARKHLVQKICTEQQEVVTFSNNSY